MTEWKIVQGTQRQRPSELDTSSSPTTVYQRRNIEKVTVTGEDGETNQLWQYEERELTFSEYGEMVRSVESPAIQQVMQSLSGIELSIEMLSLGGDI